MDYFDMEAPNGFETIHAPASPTGSQVSEAESVQSTGSTGSGKKKLIIKPKKPKSSDSSVSSVGSGDKKPRKKRTTKPNELEKYGFDPELTWTFPRFKKFLDDKDRWAETHSELKISSDSSTKGYIIDFKKGVKVEKVLVITDFSTEWMGSNTFRSFISTYTTKSSKTSRIAILHSSAKAWGEKKVSTAKDLLTSYLQTPQGPESSTSSLIESTNISVDSDGEPSCDADNVSEVTTESAIQPAPISKSFKSGEIIDYNSEMTRIMEQYQKQINMAKLAMEQQMRSLMTGYAQSLL